MFELIHNLSLNIFVFFKKPQFIVNGNRFIYGQIFIQLDKNR